MTSPTEIRGRLDRHGGESGYDEKSRSTKHPTSHSHRRCRSQMRVVTRSPNRANNAMIEYEGFRFAYSYTHMRKFFASSLRCSVLVRGRIVYSPSRHRHQDFVAACCVVGVTRSYGWHSGGRQDPRLRPIAVLRR